MLSINRFIKAVSTNSAATSFTAKIPTVTAKTTDAATGVYDLLDPSLGYTHLAHNTSRFIQIVPFGTNGNDDTFNMRVWGWSNTNDTIPVYVPQLIAQLAVVLGNISGAAIAADTYMADTITLTYGDSTSPIIAPANDLTASIILHNRGCRYIEFDWDLAGAQEGTGMNAFWRPFDQT